MKARVLLPAAFVALLACGTSSRAAFLVGDIAVDGVAISSSPTDDVTTATAFVLAINSSSPPNQLQLSAGTGDFATIADGTAVEVTYGLDTTTAPYLTLTLGAASFVGEVLSVNEPGVIPNTRAIELFGTIFPGTPAFDPTAARLILTLTQADGPGGSISISGTLATLAIPEPTSIAMVGVGLAGLAGAAGRRRSRMSARILG